MSPEAPTDLIPAQLAVMATFDPERSPANTIGGGLLESCSIEIEPVHGHRARMLSESARIDTMATILRRAGQTGLVDIRAGIEPHYPSPLQSMLDAFVLEYDVPLAERNDDELAASVHVERWSTAAFARAGLSGARIRPTREEIEGRIRVLDVERPITAQLERGFIGRRKELARLTSFLTRPGSNSSSPGLRGNPAFLVYGVGGMGKSALVARFVKDLIDDAAQSPRPIWAYLDFDRPTLQPQQSPGPNSQQLTPRTQLVLDDIVRQIGAQRPDLRSIFEYDLSSAKQAFQGGGLESLGQEADRSGAYSIASSLARYGGPVVIVLDTFEELERHGQEEAQQIYKLFDTMVEACPAMRLIVSGRTPAVPFRSSDDNKLRIDELDEDDAMELLQHFIQSETDGYAIDVNTAHDVSQIVGRSPLSLKLAARAIAGEGMQAFTDAGRRAQTLGRVRDEFVRGFLYHRIINHLKPADLALREPLKAVARAGLVLRRITGLAIDHVLLPAVGRAPSPPLAKKLFAALLQESALVQPYDAQTLIVREELRGPALSALKLDDAALVRRVHELAAAFYATDSSGANRMEAIFHRLAAGEKLELGVTRADRGPGLGLQLTDDMLDLLERSSAELPRETVNFLEVLRQGRSVLTAEDDQIAWERQAASAIDAALRRGDLAAARAALQERDARRPTTELYRLEARICEAEGNLDGAIAAGQRDLAAARLAEQPTRFAAAVAYLAKLLEWQDRGSQALAVLAEADDDALLVGEWSLRLELMLARLATAERTSLETDDMRWELGLRVRQYLTHLDSRMRESPALFRLLAAVLGRDEPTYIRDAMKLVGLDPNALPEFGVRLAQALAEWDRQFEPPDGTQGPVAQAIRLTGSSLLTDAWIARVSGLGPTASDVFGDAFWALNPPPPVTAALRAYYLHWGYQAPQSAVRRSARGGAPTHFLDLTAPDYSRVELRELESYLLTFYRESAQFERLFARSGLDVNSISWSQTITLLLRDLLNLAYQQGALEALVRAVLDDAPPEAAQRFRSIIGSDWLARHHIG